MSLTFTEYFNYSTLSFSADTTFPKCSILLMRLSTESLVRLTEFSFPASFHFDLSSSLLCLYSCLEWSSLLHSALCCSSIRAAFNLLWADWTQLSSFFGIIWTMSQIFIWSVLSCFFILFLIVHGIDVYVCCWFGGWFFFLVPFFLQWRSLQCSLED